MEKIENQEEQITTLYEINKVAHQALPNLTKEELNNSANYIKTFFEERTPDAQYWLLLSNENRYYTIFHKNEDSFSFDNLTAEVLSIVSELGGVKNISRDTTDTALGFWVEYNGTCSLFLLFDYTMGVIEVW